MMESRAHGLDDAYNHFFDAMQKATFPDYHETMPLQAQENYLRANYLPADANKTPHRKIPPANLKGEESISAEITSATRQTRC
ncbi:hypothetical protein U8P80_19530 [Rhizobium beringeri]|jgi:hypothetical protein|uniref:hypothetical protein n=1 Tax=Rhizobium TaxID=379 RepID=UPI0013E2C8BF|nr:MULTISPECIES: hypothetical protein [Rhizobium]MBY5454812.1 hypothetical protein [Rhizobium leguminosarum]WSG73593.1 hypothetical protein U8P80_19530 [Rhizobium beringeri]WSG88147.1 hypothetical protein U8P73_19385 [Rhizobium beringeri]WSH13788.1 hypothetical protein U8P74_19530 [Rhizobium beringeri]WSH26555.1 hypothetical protein U8P75_19215 [Rhizobium beringeri]